MGDLKREADFFKNIVPKIRSLVESFEGKAPISILKQLGDYATEVDIAVENLIISEIKNLFPGDLILAEEGHNDTAIPDGRIWIIDPICGTTNIGRGMKTFCTNIALADNHSLIASCVIDYTQNDYFWSVGDDVVYINEAPVQPSTRPPEAGLVFDVDMGAVPFIDATKLDKYVRLLRILLPKPGYMLESMNTSLGFAYTAINKIDGFVNMENHPWDIAASAFLVQQDGGVITDLEGNKWELSSVGAIAAKNPVVHDSLLDMYKNA